MLSSWLVIKTTIPKLLSLSTDGHFEIHVIDIGSAFAKAMAGQVLDISASSGGCLEATFSTGGVYSCYL